MLYPFQWYLDMGIITMRSLLGLEHIGVHRASLLFSAQLIARTPIKISVLIVCLQNYSMKILTYTAKLSEGCVATCEPSVVECIFGNVRAKTVLIEKEDVREDFKSKFARLFH